MWQRRRHETVEWSQSFPPPIVVSTFSITNKSFVHPFIFPNNDRQYCYWKAMEGEGEAYPCRPAKAAAEMQYKSSVCRPLIVRMQQDAVGGS